MLEQLQSCSVGFVQVVDEERCGRVRAGDAKEAGDALETAAALAGRRDVAVRVGARYYAYRVPQSDLDVEEVRALGEPCLDRLDDRRERRRRVVEAPRGD
jgi:hypothetical protein